MEMVEYVDKKGIFFSFFCVVSHAHLVVLSPQPPCQDAVGNLCDTKAEIVKKSLIGGLKRVVGPLKRQFL